MSSPTTPAARHRRGPRRGWALAVAAALLTPAVSVLSPARGAMAAPPRSPAPAPAATADAVVRDLVAAGAPGAVALVRDGSSTTVATAGVQDVRTHAPMTPTTRFRIGSTTKTFNAVLVLKLVEEHKIGLDDPIERYLPGLVPNGGHITVRHLLGMTSGLFNFTGDPGVLPGYYNGTRLLSYVWRPRQLLDIAFAHPPTHAPGVVPPGGTPYTNTAYVVTGLLVEEVTGQPFATVLERMILRPLRLTSTSYETGTIRGPHAHGYELPTPGLPPTVPGHSDIEKMNGSAYSSAGAMVSNVQDLARFYQALLSGHVVKPSSLAQMLVTKPLAGNDQSRYGLGLVVRPQGCGDAYGHGGNVLGYMSVVSLSKDGRRVGIWLVNQALDHHNEHAFMKAEKDIYCGVGR